MGQESFDALLVRNKTRRFIEGLWSLIASMRTIIGSKKWFSTAFSGHVKYIALPALSPRTH